MYTVSMTKEEIVRHWQKGAKDSLLLAKEALRIGTYDLALFHCHLAAEKALKSQWIATHENEPPHIHDLSELVHEMTLALTQESLDLCAELNQFAVEARYVDPPSAEHFATEEHARKYINRTENFLSTLLS